MKTALIIEDNAQNMYLLTYLLECAGYRVLQAFDGQRGIEMSLGHTPDIILLDIQLPKMDGYEVARELIGIHGTKSIPIVAVTSYAMPGDREKALASGATGYIEKPIDPDNFVAQLEKIIPPLHPK
ncbi:MAG: response regulator [Bacteroidetes bacterium]|jgi:CheY-like chemotaxis protein|nr:response regulator [Bacteroidota bacterium]